jgi:hypothetical protein
MLTSEAERGVTMGNVEKWDYALAILRPWVDSARVIGSPELLRVMEGAEAEALRLREAHIQEWRED